MQILDLTGVWSLKKRGNSEIQNISAEVPGGVHPALISAGIIQDPGEGDNAEKYKWVGESDWIFERPFEVDAAMLSQDIVDIEFDGIDTLSEVFVNDKSVLKTDNMFRRWRADVKDVLRAGVNTVRVEINSPRRLGAKVGARKAKYGFGSAYSPECVTAGICRPLRVRAWNEARICDLGFSQRHDEESVSVFMGGWIEVAGDEFKGLGVAFSILDPDGELVWQGLGAMPEDGDGAFNGEAEIPFPRIWWPNAMGEQPLYTVVTVLRNSSGGELDRITCRIGLRTLVVETGDDGIARVVCNGQRVFLKGGVWIPPGLFPSHVTCEDYDFLLGSAVEANLNSLRIWDGGTFEDEAFWNLCDERGIIVTGISGMFAESEDGDDDDDSGSLYRLFQHACLPDGLLNEPGEENGLCVIRDHLSYPAPETIGACISLQERNITSAAMEARVSDRRGAASLVSSMVSQWPMPSGFEDWLWLSQIAQGESVSALMAEKLRDSACSGVMWEPFASCWAIADGSSIDSLGRWKALHYLAQTTFAPLLVSGVPHDDGRVDLFVTNTGLVPWDVKLVWRATSMSGMVLDEGEEQFESIPGCAINAKPLDLSVMFEQFLREDVVVWLTLLDDEGFTLSRSQVLFAPPKHLALENPGIALDIDDTIELEGEEAFKVTLSSISPAFWVWLDIPGEEAQFSDNFVCLEPDEPMDIYVSTVNRMSQFTFRKKLRIRSLYDIKMNTGH